MNYCLKTMEEMDACVFSSDMLYNDEERKHFKAMVARWARALNETENVAPPQQPEQEIESDRPHVEDDGCPTEKAVLQRFWREHHAQPEPPCKTGNQCVGGKCERCAVQEPWGYISHRSWKMPVFVEADDLEVSGLPFNNPDYTPVYKAPPQREWQSLTDEEIEKLFVWQEWSEDFADYEPVARAIEQALREKNT